MCILLYWPAYPCDYLCLCLFTNTVWNAQECASVGWMHFVLHLFCTRSCSVCSWSQIWLFLAVSACFCSFWTKSPQAGILSACLRGPGVAAMDHFQRGVCVSICSPHPSPTQYHSSSTPPSALACQGSPWYAWHALFDLCAISKTRF